MRITPALVLSTIVCLGLSAIPAEAQFVGTFSWQSAPFCNVLTINVTQNGTAYTLDGFDAQCGADRRAPVNGVATLNPNGTVGLGLTIVNTPGGEPTHMDVAISLATLEGPWSDSAGNSGTFVFNGPATGVTVQPER